MIDANALFFNKKTNEKKLSDFGFKKKNGKYVYEEFILSGEFKITVTVDKAGMVFANISDNETNDKYVLHLLPDATGEFVGTIRTEYERVLTAVSNACFKQNSAFDCDCAKAVIEYTRKKYGDELEFLWQKFSDNAVLRRKDNRKWYAALLTVEKNKLGLKGEGKITVLDLRMRPEEAETLIDGKNYFLGYHMNKKHWLTVCLDGSVAIEEIFERIDLSYRLAKKK